MYIYIYVWKGQNEKEYIYISTVDLRRGFAFLFLLGANDVARQHGPALLMRTLGHTPFHWAGEAVGPEGVRLLQGVEVRGLVEPQV